MDDGLPPIARVISVNWDDVQLMTTLGGTKPSRTGKKKNARFFLVILEIDAETGSVDSREKLYAPLYGSCITMTRARIYLHQCVKSFYALV